MHAATRVGDGRRGGDGRVLGVALIAAGFLALGVVGVLTGAWLVVISWFVFQFAGAEAESAGAASKPRGRACTTAWRRSRLVAAAGDATTGARPRRRPSGTGGPRRTGRRPQATIAARSRGAKPLPCVYGLKQAVNASTRWLSGKRCATVTTHPGRPAAGRTRPRGRAAGKRQVRDRRGRVGPTDVRRDREPERSRPRTQEAVTIAAGRRLG